MDLSFDGRLGRVFLGVAVAAGVMLSANGDGLKAIETVPHELDVLVEAGHVQGVCCSEKAIYLTHARGIEKLDWSGRHLKHADAPAHLGDCCYHDGRIYGAFVLRGAKAGEKPGMVRVWDEELNVVAERRYDEIFGSIGILDGTAYVGITRANGKPHDGCEIRTLGLDLGEKARTTVDLGYPIAYGAQVITTDGKDLLVAVYGAKKACNFSILTPELKVKKTLAFRAAEGLAPVPKSISRRDAPVFMAVRALGGNMKKWRADPKGNPPRIRLEFYEYADGAFKDITEGK